MNRNQYLFLSASFLLASTLVASNAAAAPVDNPGTFTLTWPDGAPVVTFGGLFGSPPGPGLGRVDATGSVIIVDLDSTGAIDPSTAAAVIEGDVVSSIPGLHVQYLVTGISGTMNAQTNTAKITIQGQIRFTGLGITGSCLTPRFPALLDGPMQGSPANNVTAWKEMVIPAIPTTATCSHTATINSALGLGSTTSTVSIYKAEIDPPIKGS